MLNDMPDEMLPYVIEYMFYVKNKSDSKLYEELELISDSIMKYWNRDIDDSVWDNWRSGF
jgi:hypothetical protein